MDTATHNKLDLFARHPGSLNTLFLARIQEGYTQEEALSLFLQDFLESCVWEDNDILHISDVATDTFFLWYPLSGQWVDDDDVNFYLREAGLKRPVSSCEERERSPMRIRLQRHDLFVAPLVSIERLASFIGVKLTQGINETDASYKARLIGAIQRWEKDCSRRTVRPTRVGGWM